MEGRIYGLLGRKLGHSYSPAIHSALGNTAYCLYEREPDELADFLRQEDLGGVNVTIPYKVAALELCDVLSPEAADIGAVNTVIYRGGRLYGHNTDLGGFLHMVKEASIDFAGKKVLVLGSGGASRMACYCARRLQAKSVTVISRCGENNYENLHKHGDAEIIVNTTPVGMYPHNGASPVSLDMFPRCCGVVDLIYNPLRTALLMEAEAKNIPHVGGLSMLVAQAAQAHSLFFDLPVADETVKTVTAGIRRQCENIVLVGMPGGGKSTVGRELARMLDRPVYETDDMIVEAAGKPIPAIFAEDGEEAFRRLESEQIKKAGAMSGAVVITGGGAVTREENYAPLHQNGRIYEIQRPLDALATEGRPLSAGDAAVAKLYETRKPLYSRFRDAAVANNTTPQAAAQEIWRDFCAYTGD